VEACGSYSAAGYFHVRHLNKFKESNLKPGSKDKKLQIIISGEELSELQRHTWQMAEAFGLNRRIETYQGKRPIGLFSWDFDCLLAVIEDALNDPKEYPDKNESGYKALKSLFVRLKGEYRKFD
jgi:hypothetical protein